MKQILYFCLALLLTGLSACSDYLDINDNPDNPNNKVPSPDLRLRGILHNFSDCYDSSGTRGSWFTGNITKTYGTAANDYNLRWDPISSTTTWPYQAWFVYTAPNLKSMVERATEEEAWYYVGAAKVIHAWGFMTMVDMYGEMPYTEALTSIITPKYDDGEFIFNACLSMLDEAILEFQKTQPPTATSFASGDLWNGGDPQKWIKLAYGLKARWLNNLSKKKIYDPDAVLAALEKAPANNAESTIMHYVNSDLDNDKIIRALQHQNLGNTSSRITKWYLDLLTNTFTGGSGVTDPRTDLLAPGGQYYVNGQLQYVRTQGVDMIKNSIRTQSGPVTFDVYTRPADMNGNAFEMPTDIWYSATLIEERKGDSIYTPIYSESLADVKSKAGDPKDDRYIANRYNGSTPRIISTGTFYTRADAPGHFLCYPEMCFIKAEALFRKGDKAGALATYKNGIRAHMELMNEKLKEYDQNIFGKQVIPAEAIDKFLQSEAVAQTAGELTMAKIMQQKFIACSFSLQNWNDMRRFNYSAGNIADFGVVYIDFDRPYEFNSASQTHFPTNDPKNERYWIRRFQQCSHELNYNSENHKVSNPEATLPTVNSLPVWWDTAD
jgi:hypothetical protein